MKTDSRDTRRMVKSMSENFDKHEAASVIQELTRLTKHYAVVNISGETQAVTRFANSKISQNTNLSDIRCSLTLHDGKKEATCTTNVLDGSGLRKLVSDTEQMLLYAPESEFEYFTVKINSGGIESKNSFENGKHISEHFDAQGRADAIRLGIELLNGGLLRSHRFTAAGAVVSEKKINAYGNSENKDIYFSELDNVQFNTVITCHNGAEGGAECLSHRMEDLDISATFTLAAERAVRSSNPIQLPAGTYTVILSPVAMGDLTSFITESLNAKYAEDGESFICGKTGVSVIGSRIFGENITIIDDTHDPRVFPLYFDYEGHIRQTIPLIENGVVKNILHDNKTARRMGVNTTGHAFSNKGKGGAALHIVMAGASDTYRTVDEIINDTEKGIYISEFHYTNFVNPRAAQITGLTRNGTFLVENGKLTRAVKTMRFTQNAIDALNSVTAISKEQSKINAGGWVSVMPAARIGEFYFQ